MIGAYGVVCGLHALGPERLEAVLQRLVLVRDRALLHRSRRRGRGGCRSGRWRGSRGRLESLLLLLGDLRHPVECAEGVVLVTGEEGVGRRADGTNKWNSSQSSFLNELKACPAT